MVLKIKYIERVSILCSYAKVNYKKMAINDERPNERKEAEEKFKTIVAPGVRGS